MRWFDDLASSLGVSPSQLLLIVLLYSCVPLSLLFPDLPADPSPLPHIYSIVPAFLFLAALGLYEGILHLLAASLATWIIVKLGVRGKWGSAMPWTVFVVVMSHLTVNNIILFRHHETGVEDIGIAGSHMVLVMKLSSFAWSVYDGQRPLEALDATQANSRIVQVPGLLPFFGYCFFFPSILAGPSFGYSSYKAFTSHALYAKETGAPAYGKGTTLVPPGRRRKAVKRCLTGTAFLAIYSLYGFSVGYPIMLEKQFRERSLLNRILFMNAAGFVARTKYYAVWCIAESSYILSGIGYNPQTKKYDASRNVRIRSIEFAPNFKILLDSWNINTNIWLRECVYKRVTRRGKKPGFTSTQITFITSALWHGVNPCYLMTFVLGGFCQSLGRQFRRSLRPLFLPPVPTNVPAASSASESAPHAATTGLAPPHKHAAPPQTILKWGYDIAGIVGTQLVLNFIVAPFLLLSVDASLEAWRNVDWYGLVLVFVPIAFFQLGGRGYLRGLEKARNAKATKDGIAVDEEVERERRVWEREEEEKRLRRGEGVASLGMDVEEMVEEEKEAAAEEEKKKD